MSVRLEEKPVEVTLGVCPVCGSLGDVGSICNDRDPLPREELPLTKLDLLMLVHEGGPSR